MTLAMLDYRRRVAGIYRGYREAANPTSGWENWCEQRNALLATHSQSALPSGEQIPYAPYDPALRFEVAIETDVAPVHLDIPTATDGVVPFDRIGLVALPGLGNLDLWWLGSYGGGVFIPMKDATAAHSTYGAGRYVWDTVKGADHGGDVDPTTGKGTLVLDLNLAYHPSCAYNPAWVCPLATTGNVLSAPVMAGELLPPGGWY